jgi:DNA-binding NarL/FixJ family response regulator
VNDLYVGGKVAEALTVVDAELAAGGDPCPLLPLKVNLLLEGFRPGEAWDLLPSALASLDRPGLSVAAQMMAFTHLVQYANHVGRVDVAADLIDRLSGLPEIGSPVVQLATHELIAYADWRPGLAARLQTHLDAARRLRPDAITMSIGGSFESAQARLHWMRGEWDEMLALMRTAGLDLRQRGVITGAVLFDCEGCEILIDRGAHDEATALAATLETPIEALQRSVAIVQARLAAAIGDQPTASAILEAERDRARAVGASLWRLCDVLWELASIRLDEGRTSEAMALVDEAEAVAGQLGWPECRLPALRARAVVHRDVEAAHAYAALADDEAWPIEQARAALVLGELDVEPMANLVKAYKAYDAFGAAPWRRRAAAALRARGLSVPRRAAQRASVLSETEVQLVRLVAQGLSNRQIATAMHYSNKTIEVYLSRLYAKTGCGSRLELIRAVDTGALTVD